MLLDAQGLTRTDGDLARLIEQLGFVQVDTISAVERAHHLTLWSRMPQYRHEALTALLEQERVLFEHWTHDASIIPLRWYPHWQHRFARYRKRIRKNKWWRERLGSKPDRLIREVRERIERVGPLLSRDFEHNGKTQAWWGWKPQKAALEHLWRCGELAIARRMNFQKVYDLAERVIPEHHAKAAPEWDAHVDWACRSALERLGPATPGEIAAFWHAIDPSDARRWCDRAQKRGEIAHMMMQAEDGSTPRAAFARAADVDQLRNGNCAKPPATPGPRQAAMTLLNPFDPALRDRKRTRRLFNFDYTFEAFVPEAKRKYGYFVMPILEGDRLVGRLNPKFHRERSVLEIKGLWWEPQVKVTKTRMCRLQEAVEDLARFLGAANITFP